MYTLGEPQPGVPPQTLRKEIKSSDDTLPSLLRPRFLRPRFLHVAHCYAPSRYPTRLPY
jgi:hypothetical protein